MKETRSMTRLTFAAASAFALAFVSAPALAQNAAPAAATETAPMAKAQHAAFTKLLKKYVSEDADGVNRVDYAAWKASEADSGALDAYVGTFANMDFDAMSRDEAFAAWSNLYNAVTVQHILDRYPVKSIRSGYITGPWKRVKAEAGGETVSLHEIEHEILREMGDGRVHYAINCASFSCPDLPLKAWEASTLDKDLDAAAADYINDPRGVTVTDRGLVVSEIYKWFEDDFGGSKATVIEHLLEYAEPDLAAQIKEAGKIRKYDYDWSLNDVEG